MITGKASLKSVRMTRLESWVMLYGKNPKSIDGVAMPRSWKSYWNDSLCLPPDEAHSIAHVQGAPLIPKFITLYAKIISDE